MYELLVLLAFMTLPLWIPVNGVAAGTLVDTVRIRRGDAPEPSVVERLRARRAAEGSTPAPV